MASMPEKTTQSLNSSKEIAELIMSNIYATVLLTPNPGKSERVKELLSTIARQVEDTQSTVLQYQLFEQVSKRGGLDEEDRKIIVHIDFKDQEALDQYHALSTFQTFWGAIEAEKLLSVPLDPKICASFGGFKSRA